MRAEDRISQLERELAEEQAKNARLQAELATLQAEHARLQPDPAQLRQQLEQLLSRLREVEGRLAKESHNRSKPPSSDGPARKPRSQRKASGKQMGGQPGHVGRTLLQVATSEEVVPPRPAVCVHCQQDLAAVAGRVKERRQVHDLPQVRLVVREQQVEQVRCPVCQQMNEGRFPRGVQAPAKSGPNVRALAVDLQQYQLVPLARTCEWLEDLCDGRLSEATLRSWVEQAATTLEPTMQQRSTFLAASRVQHGEETGIRVQGKLRWVQVKSRRWWTQLAWHPKRGQHALSAALSRRCASKGAACWPLWRLSLPASPTPRLGHLSSYEFSFYEQASGMHQM